MVGLFNGIAIGSGVIVAKYYGARDIANLQKSKTCDQYKVKNDIRYRRND